MNSEINFSGLGVPFPLFDAPVEQSAEYGGVGTCTLCGTNDRHCFVLGIGCALMCECPRCGTVNGLDAVDMENVDCRKCKSTISFPEISDEDGEISICYECLRGGRAAVTHDTELGMISWDDDALDNGSNGAGVPLNQVWEIIRTPKYETIQGERWLLCCKQLMIFVGGWTRQQFSDHAPDGDGEAYFHAIVEGVVPGLWKDQLHDTTGVYVFKCGACGRKRGHWDIF